jgi:signal transduction histidine kinase
VTALGKLFRTTAFKLSIAYLVVFAIGAGFVLGSVAWNVKGLMDEQISQTIEAEITGLSEQYAQGGMRRLVDVIERRARVPGSSLYLLTTFAGETLAGNIAVLPPGVLDRPGVVETNYQRPGEAEPTHRALARIFVLPAGFRLVVGHDLADRETLRHVMGRALLTSVFWLIIIGTIGGLVVARRVLRRVDAMSDSARTIMQGDLARRLPLAGTQDELDRLAENLNAMLDRIAELMKGLQEVSDNIAHDLRTPLTRLRNGAEQALRSAQDPSEHKAALEKVIEESDGLIRIFNALLMIARVEAGAARDDMGEFNVAEVARDVAELYEPFAEEQGVTLSVDADGDLLLRGNRELVGQALANLVDNAFKYGVTAGAPSCAIQIAARRTSVGVELEVSDRGPGIAETDRQRVRDRFVRLEGSRSRPGSGLGLSLAVAVAHLHGGELRMEDNAPGLRVILAMPADAPGTARVLSQSALPRLLKASTAA